MIEMHQYDSKPSPALAFEDGEHHFDSIKYPAAYDINRAQYFFQLALMQDPHLPYIYHELARVAFLEGNFPLALAYIDVQIQNEGDKTPNSYYVRALIEGFMGNYADAETDYSHYLTFDPINWAAVNDYSWVLLKDNKPKQADAAIEKVLTYFPSNAWLLNSDAIALSEMGNATSAKARIDAASEALSSLTPQSWTDAYPGNDPNIAGEGLNAFRAAVAENMHSLDVGNVAHALQ
jgi:tetratricopeptide (TPR) repeat protein